MLSVINQIVNSLPAAGYRAFFVRLGASEAVELRDLHARAEQLALHLIELGVKQKDRIGILATNCLEWVLLDLAALRLKAVTAGFEPGKFEPDGALLARYDLTVLFTDEPFTADGIRPISEVRSLVDQLGSLRTLPNVEYRPDETTTLKFTSGSTGQPKVLAATAGSIDSSLRGVQEMFAHGADDHLFVFLPLSILQQRYWIYSALCFGHDVTISTYEAAFTAMRGARPTVVMAVPAFYETAKRYLEAEADPRVAARRLFGDRIRYLWTGSAPASTEILRFFENLGFPIYEGYGLNETCIVTKNYPGSRREGSVGRVMPGKRVLLDSDGVIVVRSDYPVARRYEYAAPGESEKIFQEDGAVWTGDIGYFDEDNFLYIRGRIDDMVVLENGKNVAVRPIEEYMKVSSAVEECVLFYPNRTYLVAVVSPSNEPADEAAIYKQLVCTNAAFGPDQQIKNVIIANPRFSVENNLLSSQFKPKRKQIFDAYRQKISENKGVFHAR